MNVALTKTTLLIAVVGIFVVMTLALTHDSQATTWGQVKCIYAGKCNPPPPPPEVPEDNKNAG